MMIQHLFPVDITTDNLLGDSIRRRLVGEMKDVTEKAVKVAVTTAAVAMPNWKAALWEKEQVEPAMLR